MSAGNEGMLRGTGAVFNQCGFMDVDVQNMTEEKGLFCAGDMSHGASLVVKAIASGFQTAQSVAGFLEH